MEGGRADPTVAIKQSSGGSCRLPAVSGAAFFAGCLATREALSPSGWDPAALCSGSAGVTCWFTVLSRLGLRPRLRPVPRRLRRHRLRACGLRRASAFSHSSFWSLACVQRVSKTACAFSSGLLFFRVVGCCVCCVCCGFEVWGPGSLGPARPCLCAAVRPRGRVAEARCSA